MVGEDGETDKEEKYHQVKANNLELPSAESPVDLNRSRPSAHKASRPHTDRHALFQGLRCMEKLHKEGPREGREAEHEKAGGCLLQGHEKQPQMAEVTSVASLATQRSSRNEEKTMSGQGFSHHVKAKQKHSLDKRDATSISYWASRVTFLSIRKNKTAPCHLIPALPWVVALMVRTYMLFQSQVWGMVSGDPASGRSALHVHGCESLP